MATARPTFAINFSRGPIRATKFLNIYNLKQIQKRDLNLLYIRCASKVRTFLLFLNKFVTNRRTLQKKEDEIFDRKLNSKLLIKTLQYWFLLL